MDLDIIKESDLGQLLRAAGMPAGIVESLNGMKQRIRLAFTQTDANPKNDGISCLDDSSRAEALHLLSVAAEYGVFIVDVGALEGWLSALGACGRNATERFADLLEKLGTDPDAEGYVRPSDDGVWAFVRRVLDWIANPSRKGV